jgi:hypothetical protein
VTDPFPDDRAYLDAELERLECRLRAAVERFDGPVDEFGALYVSRAEVERLLGMDGAPEVSTASTAETARLESLTRRLRERLDATRAADHDLAVQRLVDRLELDPVEREVLVLALAPDVDDAFATVYAFLQDDATQRRPTAGFAAGLLDADRFDVRAALSPGSPLVAHDVVHLDGNGPLPTRTVRVDERVVAVLLGEEGLGPAQGDAVTLTEPEESIADLAVDRRRKHVLEGLAAGDDGAAPFVAVSGPEGAGKRAQVAAICAGRGRALVTVHADRVEAADLPSVVADAVEDARLRDAAVHVAGRPPDADRLGGRTLRLLDDLDGPIFTTTATPLPASARTAVEDHEVVPLSVERAGYDQRRRYWAGIEDLPEGVDPSALAAKFRLTRGAIDDAMAAARARARATGEALSAAHVHEGCRSQSSERLADLAQRVEPTEGWDDIVLPAEQATQLREVAARVGDQGTVYEEWGFAETATLGNGLVALFSGPSGTGKTMAAEVVAADAGLGLYKVDLSAVVSKYVGETESNLGEIFDEAADSDAILLFDEADALFGERSDVSDAHDRYANVEVNYLLQRVEEHDGTVLLTTNLEANIDDAFRRRIHVSVEFPFPDRRSRTEIWRRSFPEATPVGDLDYEFLGGLELAGGNIRNAALTAAFLAADEGTDVGMSQVVRGVKREFQKTGTLVEPDRFREYSEFLDDP